MTLRAKPLLRVNGKWFTSYSFHYFQLNFSPSITASWRQTTHATWISQLAPDLRQVAQRQIYHDIIAAALTEPAFDGVWLWGFTDKHTWVTQFYFEDEPLIFDESYERKDSYYGLRDALTSITPGGTVGASVLLDSDEDEDGNPWGHPWIQPLSDIDTQSSARQDYDDVEGDQRPDWQL